MSAFHRLLPLPATRRAYSFFSSRSGGGNGRYFSSPKQQVPKPVVAPTTSKKDGVNADLSKDHQTSVASVAVASGVAATQATSAVSSTASSSATSGPNGPKSSTPTNASTSSTGTTSSGSSASSTTPNNTPSSSSSASTPSTPSAAPNAFQLANAFAEITRSAERDTLHHHLDIGSKDFKMHQFFALHRPLLLISQPSTLFRHVGADIPISGLPPPAPSAPSYMDSTTASLLGFQPTSEGGSVIDADAEAARQLTRALTMNQAGPAIQWENTLRHLGLDPAKDADRVGLQEQFDKEWNEVMMDSTKRKRRKKMKKHKLKKRRRLTRASRQRE